MNINETSEKTAQIKSSELAKADSFDEAIASRNAIIDKKNKTIADLEKRLGTRESYISELMEKFDNEKSLRIDAEKKVTEGKPLEKPGRHYIPKSKEEQFAEQYREACQRIRNK